MLFNRFLDINKDHNDRIKNLEPVSSRYRNIVGLPKSRDMIITRNTK